MNTLRWTPLLTLALLSTARADLLDNGAFEAPYTPAVSTGDAANQKARITGQVSQGWSDNSGWADVTVDYAADPAVTHGGHAAQRIDVREIRSGSVQFVQTKSLIKNHIYRGEVWLRSAHPENVEVALRQAGAPYRSYISRLAEVSDSWTKVSLTTLMPEDAATYFMIRPTGPGTLWVDDASLDDMTNATSTAPPRAGNLVTNGSFEAGFGGGWSFRSRLGPTLADAARFEFEDRRYTVDNSTASVGKLSLKTVLPAGLGFYVWSPPFEFNFGRVHTASVDLKADRENVPVELAFDGTPVKKTVTVGTTWQRYFLSGALPYAPQTSFKLTCFSGATPATLWADGVQVKEDADAAAPYQPATAAELTLSVNRPGAVFFDGEPAAVKVAVSDLPRGSHLHCTLTDLYGTAHPLADLPFPANEITIPPAPDHPRGMFKLRAQVISPTGAPLSPSVDQVFARLPRPRELDPENSFFGVHIPLTPEYIAIARAVGARWARLHDASVLTKWPAVEPTKDNWQFVDEGAQAARRGGMKILGMFDGAPLWTTIHPRATTGYWSNYNLPDTPGALNEWDEYVRRTANHYKGTIDYWEVWNEPWGTGNFPGTPEQYGELLKRAYPAAKAGNPSATIVGVDAAIFRPAFTEGALKTAGTDSFDAFSYHDYNSSLYGGPNAPAIRNAASLREAQNKVGTAKPIWLTEGGAEKLASWYGDQGDGISPRTQLAYAVRFDVTNLGAGVKHFFYYTLHADPQFGSDGYCALEHDRSIRPLLAARAVLASLIDGLPCQGRTEPVEGVDAYTFGPDHGKTVTVLWSYSGTSHEVPVPPGTQVLDVQGNPIRTKATLQLGDEPIYFLR